MTRRTADQSMWETAKETGCPFQRYQDGHPLLELGHIGVWVAQATPPCKKRTCGLYGCHNFGKVFEGADHNPNRFWIVDPKPTQVQHTAGQSHD